MCNCIFSSYRRRCDAHKPTTKSGEGATHQKKLGPAKASPDVHMGGLEYFNPDLYRIR
jgi:hypothetical protein